MKVQHFRACRLDSDQQEGVGGVVQDFTLIGAHRYMTRSSFYRDCLVQNVLFYSTFQSRLWVCSDVVSADLWEQHGPVGTACWEKVKTCLLSFFSTLISFGQFCNLPFVAFDLWLIQKTFKRLLSESSGKRKSQQTFLERSQWLSSLLLEFYSTTESGLILPCRSEASNLFSLKDYLMPQIINTSVGLSMSLSQQTQRRCQSFKDLNKERLFDRSLLK